MIKELEKDRKGIEYLKMSITEEKHHYVTKRSMRCDKIQKIEKT